MRAVKIILVIYIFVFFHFFQMDMMDSVGQILQHQLHLTTQKMGIIDSAFFYADFLMIFIAGITLDIFDPKYLMIFSIFINLIGISIFYSLPSFNTLLFWRILAGIGMAYSFISALKIIATRLRKDKLGVAFAVIGFAIMPAGIMAHRPLLSFIQHYGVMDFYHVYLMSGALIIMIIYVALGASNKNNDESNSLSIKMFSVYNFSAALYSSFANLPLFILGASFGMDYVMKNYFMTTTQAAYIISLLFIGDMLGSLLWGTLFDKFKGHGDRLLVTGAMIYFLVSSGFFIIKFHPTIYLAGGLFFMLGLVTSTQTISYVSIMVKNPSISIGKVISLTSLLSVGMGAIFEYVFTALFKNSIIANGFIWIILSGFLVCIAAFIAQRNKIRVTHEKTF